MDDLPIFVVLIRRIDVSQVLPKYLLFLANCDKLDVEANDLLRSFFDVQVSRSKMFITFSRSVGPLS